MPVRRRAVRRYKPKYLFFALLAACLAAAGLCAYLFWPRTYEDLPRAEDTTVLFSNRESADVASVTVRNGQGETYVITQDGDTTAMDGDESFDFSDSMLSDALTDAAYVYTEREIIDLNDSDTLTAKDFGFDDDCIRVTAVYTDGEQLTFSIGDLLPEETPAYYLMVEGDTHIYTVDQDTRDTFSRARLALHSVPDPALNADLIDKITFTGDNAFAIERRAGDDWYLTAPFEYPLSGTAVDTLLEKLENLRFSQFAADADKVDLSAYGLDAPRRTMTIDIAASVLTGYDENDAEIGSVNLDAYQLDFVFGNDANDVVFYCLYRGQILKASYFTAGFTLSQGYDGLLLGNLINIPTNRLTEMKITENGETHVYTLSLVERVLENNELEKDEDGNVLYDVLVYKDGVSCDSDAFLTAYGQMTEMSAVTALSADWQAEGAPELTVTLQWDGGTREMNFYPCDALHWGVEVNGIMKYEVENTWMDNVSLP